MLHCCSGVNVARLTVMLTISSSYRPSRGCKTRWRTLLVHQLTSTYCLFPLSPSPSHSISISSLVAYTECSPCLHFISFRFISYHFRCSFLLLLLCFVLPFLLYSPRFFSACLPGPWFTAFALSRDRVLVCVCVYVCVRAGHRSNSMHHGAITDFFFFLN